MQCSDSEHVIRLHQTKHYVKKDIAKLVGVSHSTVKRAIRHFQQTGEVREAADVHLNSPVFLIGPGSQAWPFVVSKRLLGHACTSMRVALGPEPRLSVSSNRPAWPGDLQAPCLSRERARN